MPLFLDLIHPDPRIPKEPVRGRPRKKKSTPLRALPEPYNAIVDIPDLGLIVFVEVGPP